MVTVNLSKNFIRMLANSRNRLGALVWWSVALLALIGITILVASLYYQLMLRDARNTEGENLAAIADLKADLFVRVTPREGVATKIAAFTKMPEHPKHD